MGFLCFFVLLLFPFAAMAEYNTMEEIAEAYSVEACRHCHAQKAEEWHTSGHSRSLVTPLAVTRKFILARREQGKRVERDELMRCMVCHAPQLEKASETLIGEVVRLILKAADDKDPGREEAEKSLSPLSVNCGICHNQMAILEKALKGKPKKGVFYGPAGKLSPAHGTEKSASFGSYLLCGQCHRIITHTDGELVFCSSAYESYQENYRGWGGADICQDCHMKRKDRGHRFPGARDADLLRDGLELQVKVAGLKAGEPPRVPTAFVEVQLASRAGHRTPDG
jgi:hypothetical protein